MQLGLAVSLPLFLLSGLSWPAQATSEPRVILAKLLPGTAGLVLLTLLFAGIAFWRWTPAAR